MLLEDIVTLWAAFLLIWALVNRGIPIFQELVRDMTDFFMEKALGPGADLFEGRAGSAACREALFTVRPRSGRITWLGGI